MGYVKKGVEKKCESCGGLFINKAPTQRFCQISCQRQFSKIIRRENTKIEIVCLGCSQPFTTNTKTKKYCSPKCKPKDYKRRNGAIREAIVCFGCLNTFIPIRGAQIYCSKQCRENKKNEAYRSRSVIRVNNCELCGVDISDKQAGTKFCSSLCLGRATRNAVKDTKKFKDSKKIYQIERRKKIGKISKTVKKDIERLLKIEKCYYCGSNGEMHLEHKIPVSRGGSNFIGNLIMACAKCNQTKNRSTIMEWRIRMLKKGIVINYRRFGR